MIDKDEPKTLLIENPHEEYDHDFDFTEQKRNVDRLMSIVDRLSDEIADLKYNNDVLSDRIFELESERLL